MINRRRPRRVTSQTAPGGRRWLAVLVLSALLLLGAGWQLVDGRTAGAQASAGQTLIAPPAPVRTPQATAGSAPATAVGTTRGWSTSPATPSPERRVVTPERLRIPVLGLDLPVDPTGVDDHGQMALPERPTRVGWYAFGAAPGDKGGTAVLAGHVDSARYGIGPLAGLAGLERGADVVVTGSGATTRYTVIAVQRVGKKDLRGEQLFARAGDPLLRIVTCGGSYDPEHGYADNVVVTARPR